MLADLGPWAFGWEALVAVGTLALAGGTAWLAWTTRSVARATQAELAAAWRPLLVFHSASVEQRDGPADVRILLFAVRNDGRGPALSVAAATVQRGGEAVSTVYGIIRVGETESFQFPVPLDAHETLERVVLD